MIKVIRKTGESAERLLKRFSGHVKSRRLMQKFRSLRYNKQEPRKIEIRKSALMREKYRAEAKKRQYQG